jgi:hypothetical protein
MHKKIIVILLLFSSFCPYLCAEEELKVENRGLSVSCSLSEDSKQNEGLEIVMTHNCLLDAIRKGDLICLGYNGSKYMVPKRSSNDR